MAVAFWAFAGLAVVSALAVVLASRPLRAAVALLLHMVGLAGLYLTLHAMLLSVLQLFVYAGAVVTLFVLVVMMIGPDGAAAEPPTPAGGLPGGQAPSPLPRVVGVAAALLFLACVPAVLWLAAAGTAGPPDGLGTLAWMGNALWAERWLAVELVGVLLLVAAVSAMALQGPGGAPGDHPSLGEEG